IRQRTRWITGISLQSWERHGWFGNAGTLYWLWRDRKGLVGNPASLLTSFLLVYGSLTWCGSVAAGEKWRLGGLLNESMALLLMGTSLLQAVRLGVRAWCSAGVYGWRFASLVPLR